MADIINVPHSYGRGQGFSPPPSSNDLAPAASTYVKTTYIDRSKFTPTQTVTDIGKRSYERGLSGEALPDKDKPIRAEELTFSNAKNLTSYQIGQAVKAGWLKLDKHNNIYRTYNRDGKIVTEAVPIAQMKKDYTVQPFSYQVPENRDRTMSEIKAGILPERSVTDDEFTTTARRTTLEEAAKGGDIFKHFIYNLTNSKQDFNKVRNIIKRLTGDQATQPIARPMITPPQTSGQEMAATAGEIGRAVGQAVTLGAPVSAAGAPAAVAGAVASIPNVVSRFDAVARNEDNPINAGIKSILDIAAGAGGAAVSAATTGKILSSPIATQAGKDIVKAFAKDWGAQTVISAGQASGELALDMIREGKDIATLENLKSLASATAQQAAYQTLMGAGLDVAGQAGRIAGVVSTKAKGAYKKAIGKVAKGANPTAVAQDLVTDGVITNNTELQAVTEALTDYQTATKVKNADIVEENGQLVVKEPAQKETDGREYLDTKTEEAVGRNIQNINKSQLKQDKTTLDVINTLFPNEVEIDGKTQTNFLDPAAISRTLRVFEEATGTKVNKTVADTEATNAMVETVAQVATGKLRPDYIDPDKVITTAKYANQTANTSGQVAVAGDDSFANIMSQAERYAIFDKLFSLNSNISSPELRKRAILEAVGVKGVGAGDAREAFATNKKVAAMSPTELNTKIKASGLIGEDVPETKVELKTGEETTETIIGSQLAQAGEEIPETRLANPDEIGMDYPSVTAQRKNNPEQAIDIFEEEREAMKAFADHLNITDENVLDKINNGTLADVKQVAQDIIIPALDAEAARFSQDVRTAVNAADAILTSENVPKQITQATIDPNDTPTFDFTGRTQMVEQLENIDSYNKYKKTDAQTELEFSGTPDYPTSGSDARDAVNVTKEIAKSGIAGAGLYLGAYALPDDPEFDEYRQAMMWGGFAVIPGMKRLPQYINEKFGVLNKFKTFKYKPINNSFREGWANKAIKRRTQLDNCEAMVKAGSDPVKQAEVRQVQESILATNAAPYAGAKLNNFINMIDGSGLTHAALLHPGVKKIELALIDGYGQGNMAANKVKRLEDDFASMAGSKKAAEDMLGLMYAVNGDIYPTIGKALMNPTLNPADKFTIVDNVTKPEAIVSSVKAKAAEFDVDLSNFDDTTILGLYNQHRKIMDTQSENTLSAELYRATGIKWEDRKKAREEIVELLEAEKEAFNNSLLKQQLEITKKDRQKMRVELNNATFDFVSLGKQIETHNKELFKLQKRAEAQGATPSELKQMNDLENTISKLKEQKAATLREKQSLEQAIKNIGSLSKKMRQLENNAYLARTRQLNETKMWLDKIESAYKDGVLKHYIPTRSNKNGDFLAVIEQVLPTSNKTRYKAVNPALSKINIAKFHSSPTEAAEYVAKWINDNGAKYIESGDNKGMYSAIIDGEEVLLRIDDHIDQGKNKMVKQTQAENVRNAVYGLMSNKDKYNTIIESISKDVKALSSSQTPTGDFEIDGLDMTYPDLQAYNTATYVKGLIDAGGLPRNNTDTEVSAIDLINNLIRPKSKLFYRTKHMDGWQPETFADWKKLRRDNVDAVNFSNRTTIQTGYIDKEIDNQMTEMMRYGIFDQYYNDLADFQRKLYHLTPEHLGSLGKSIARMAEAASRFVSFAYLGMNPESAMRNLLQGTLSTSNALMRNHGARDASILTWEVPRTVASVLQVGHIGDSNIFKGTANEQIKRDILQRVIDRGGIDDFSARIEGDPRLGGKALGQKLITYGYATQRIPEYFNRTLTAVAEIDLLLKNTADPASIDIDEAAKNIQSTIHQAHGWYIPEVRTGFEKGLTRTGLRSLLTFAAPSINELNNWRVSLYQAKNGTLSRENKKKILPLVGLAIGTGILGGLNATPLFPMLISILDKYQTATSGDEPASIFYEEGFIDTYKSTMRNALTDAGMSKEGADKFLEMTIYGIPSSALNSNLSWSGSPLDLTEPVLIDYMSRLFKDFSEGDVAALGKTILQSMHAPTKVARAVYQASNNVVVDKDFNTLRTGYGLADAFKEIVFGKDLNDVKASRNAFMSKFDIETPSGRKDFTQQLYKSGDGLSLSSKYETVATANKKVEANWDKIDPYEVRRRLKDGLSDPKVQKDIEESNKALNDWLSKPENTKRLNQLAYKTDDEVERFGKNVKLATKIKSLQRSIFTYHYNKVRGEVLNKYAEDNKLDLPRFTFTAPVSKEKSAFNATMDKLLKQENRTFHTTPTKKKGKKTTVKRKKGLNISQGGRVRL